jgi:hypothetical protein
MFYEPCDNKQPQAMCQLIRRKLLRTCTASRLDQYYEYKFNHLCG